MLPLTIAPDVAHTLKTGGAVVALESTIITHGMPYPANFETAQAVEAEIRDQGAVPATIAVVQGEIKIGLSETQLRNLAQVTGAAKLSRADLAAALVLGQTGGTTVAATMICAHLAGIRVFATGGIGGVHRGAEHSFDISADLPELAETAVTVVCAGAKAILDLPKTFETLETLGVPVIAYGQEMIPAFWSRDSGIRAPLQINSPQEIARAHLMRRALGLKGGQLVTNPIPQADEIAAETLAPVIENAVRKADAQNITAKALTPFLLAEILEATQGASLAANIALIRNNARLGAQIALAMAMEP